MDKNNHVVDRLYLAMAAKESWPPNIYHLDFRVIYTEVPHQTLKALAMSFSPGTWEMPLLSVFCDPNLYSDIWILQYNIKHSSQFPKRKLLKYLGGHLTTEISGLSNRLLGISIVTVAVQIIFISSPNGLQLG